MKRCHDINSQEIAVKNIIISTVHALDMKPLGQENTSKLVVAIGYPMGGVPPKTARIKDVGSGQDQPSSRIKKFIYSLQELKPFFQFQVLDYLK